VAYRASTLKIAMNATSPTGHPRGGSITGRVEKNGNLPHLIEALIRGTVLIIKRM